MNGRVIFHIMMGIGVPAILVANVFILDDLGAAMMFIIALFTLVLNSTFVITSWDNKSGEKF